MNTCFRNAPVLGAAICALWMALPANAQQERTLNGVILNFGVVPAQVALVADGHREAHPVHPPPGSQHLLVTLDAASTHRRIGDAEVLMDVTDPHGRVERKLLLHTHAGGLADFSELFEFEWSGEYKVHAVITLHDGTSFQTRFTVHHSV